MTFELLSAGGEGKIEPYRVNCRPGTRAERDTHPGEEFTFILRSQLEIGVGEEVFIQRPAIASIAKAATPRLAQRIRQGMPTDLGSISAPSRLQGMGRGSLKLWE